MSDDELARLEALAAWASDGPWHSSFGVRSTYGKLVAVTYHEGQDNTTSAADAAFIAASRTAVPNLIAEVRLLRSVLGDVQEDGHVQVRQIERLRRIERAARRHVEAYDGRLPDAPPESWRYKLVRESRDELRLALESEE